MEKALSLNSFTKVMAWLLAGITLCFTNARAENRLPTEEGSITYGGITLPYRIIKTSPETAGTTVLAMYLHGGTSKGSDNIAQMKEPGIDSIANYLTSHNIKAILLVPQCPADKSWSGPTLPMLKALIAQYTDSGEADPDKVYLFGGSMGGTGTWTMLSNYPNTFAAAMPVAANPSRCNAESTASTPVFTVMGTDDKIMSVETAATFVSRLIALGGEVEMETEERWTHEDTCIKSYTNTRLDWVFSHTRIKTAVGETVASEGHGSLKQYFYIDGKPVIGSPTPGIYIEMCTPPNGGEKVWRKVWRL